jgi:hypothetical protein
MSNKTQRYTDYLETALHVSGGTITHHQERKQLSTATDICHAVIAICRYRGRVGTGLSVLWVESPPTAHSHQFQLFHDSGR